MNSSSLHWQPKSLALFRIGLGCYVTVYTLIALYWCTTFFTDEGVLRISTLTWLGEGGGSIFLAIRWWVWPYVLLSGQLLAAICLTCGFRTHQVILPLTYLVWSLQARNPYIVGLPEKWLICLLLCAALLPVADCWTLEKSKCWGAAKFFDRVRPALCYFLFLLYPAALLLSALESGDGNLLLTFLGMASLFGLLLPIRYASARNLAVVFHLGWVSQASPAGTYWLLSGVACFAFLHFGEMGMEVEAPAIVLVRFALLLLLIQSPFIIDRLTKESFTQEVQALKDRDLSQSYDRFRYLQAASGEQPAELFPQLRCQSLFMRRFLNHLYQHTEHSLAAALIDSQLGEGEIKTYSLMLAGSGEETDTFLFQLQTSERSGSIWDRLPSLDREENKAL